MLTRTWSDLGPDDIPLNKMIDRGEARTKINGGEGRTEEEESLVLYTSNLPANMQQMIDAATLFHSLTHASFFLCSRLLLSHYTSTPNTRDCQLILSYFGLFYVAIVSRSALYVYLIRRFNHEQYMLGNGIQSWGASALVVIMSNIYLII